MRIGIDISQIVYKGTGVSRFTEGLVEAILNFDDENEWIFFFSSFRRKLPRELEKKIEERKHRLVRIHLGPKILSFMWNKLHLVSIERFTGELDWFITSDWTEPPAQCKKATIVHDLAYLQYPDSVFKSIKETQASRIGWVKKESSLIFSDSITTKNDIEKLLHISNTKTILNYPGVDIHRVSDAIVEGTLKKFNINKSYILAVGKIEPRKNLKRLIAAFNKLEQEDAKLVIVGPSGWETIEPQKNVQLLGYLEDDELSAIYQSALFFIYPSVWEGFGYPVVEAMKMGIAVATSNTSSLGEIASEGSLLFNPESVDEIRKAMSLLLHDKALRQTLVEKGKERAKLFTWKKYYETMMRELKSKKTI